MNFSAIRQTPDILRISPVAVIFETVRGIRRPFQTDSSALLFHRLRGAALVGERVGRLTENGFVCDLDSTLALNCYLRTAQLGRGGRFPFSRLQLRGDTSRAGWAMFKHYLGLEFV